MGQTIGYRRVSSADQNTARQLEGLTLDRVFEDKISGSTIKRPALVDCLDYCRAGDRLVVHSIDRLARNLADLESLVSQLNQKGIEVRFVKENLTFSGGENPMNMLMFQMLGAFAQFERSMIRERQREGIAIAKQQGRHLGRVKTLTDAQESEIRSRVASGETKKGLAGEYGVSRQTIYSVLGRL